MLQKQGYMVVWVMEEEVQKEQKAQEDGRRMFAQFYPDELLSDFNSRLETLFHPGIIAPDYQVHRTPTEYYRFIKELDCEEVMSLYWSLHRQEYLQRLDSLIHPLPDEFISEDVQLVVAIAARNETDVQKVIDVLRIQYGADFETHVRIVVYHNYVDEPDDEVREAMAALTTTSNIALIEEQVEEFNNVASAKKVASDLVQRLIPSHRDIPLLFTDADVRGMTQDAIQVGITKLEDPTVLAVSAGYDIEEEAANRFPVLGLVARIKRLVAKKGFEEDLNMQKLTIGPFTLISRKTHAAIGGTKAVTPGPYIVTFEDMKMTSDLETAVFFAQMKGEQQHPVYPLETSGHFIMLEPSREVEALMEGHFTDDRWHRTSMYQTTSGTRRFNWRGVPTQEEIPELAEMTSDNLALALTKQFDSDIVAMLTSGEYNPKSRRYLSVLSDLGFTPIIHAYKDGEERKEGDDAIAAINGQDSEWGIRRFISVTRKQSS